MASIRRFYEELNKFWREEICQVAEALKKRRVDRRDFERWNSFRSSLNQTIEFWKVCFLPLLTMNSQPIEYYVQNRLPSCDTQTLPSNNTSPSAVRLFPLPLWCFFRLTVCRELTLGR
jgi:hypothetical protein